MVLFGNSANVNGKETNNLGSRSSRKLGLGALVLLHFAGCTKDDSTNASLSTEQVNQQATARAASQLPEPRPNKSQKRSGPLPKPQLTVKATVTVGDLSVSLLDGTEINVADRSADGVRPVTAKPILFPLSQLPGKDLSYVAALGAKESPNEIQVYKMSFLIDSPHIEALGRGACPQKQAVQTKDGRYWESSEDAIPQSAPGRYFRFPISGIDGKLLDPVGKEIGDIKFISVPDSQVLAGDLEVSAHEAKTWIKSNPTLKGCRAIFTVWYPGVSEETATLSVQLSEKIIKNASDALNSEQTSAGGKVSLMSRDTACNIISQSIKRTIESDGPKALDLLTVRSIDELSGRIYEFFMSRSNQLTGHDLKAELLKKETITWLTKTIQQTVVDTSREKHHEIHLFYKNRDDQWEKLDEKTDLNTATLQGGLAIGGFSAGGATSSSHSSSEAVRSAWQESLKTQHGIETEVETNTGYLKIVSLRSDAIINRDNKLLINEISDIRLRIGYGPAELPPIVIEFADLSGYRKNMIELFPVTEENRKVAESLSAFVCNQHHVFSSTLSNGVPESVLSSFQSLYDGVMRPEDLARVINPPNGATNLQVKATLQPSSLSTNGDARGYWTSVLHLESKDPLDSIDIVVPHCGRLVSDDKKFLPEFVDPAAAMLAELKASGFEDIAELLDQVALVEDFKDVTYLQHVIATSIQALSSTRRQRIYEILDQTKKHLAALYDVTTWLSPRLPAVVENKNEGVK